MIILNLIYITQIQFFCFAIDKMNEFVLKLLKKMSKTTIQSKHDIEITNAMKSNIVNLFIRMCFAQT